MFPGRMGGHSKGAAKRDTWLLWQWFPSFWVPAVMLTWYPCWQYLKKLRETSCGPLRIGEIPRLTERQFFLISLQEVLIPEMKWRKVCPASRSLSLPDNIPCIPRASMDSVDSFFPSRKPPGSGELRVLLLVTACKDQAFPAPTSAKGEITASKASENCFLLYPNP